VIQIIQPNDKILWIDCLGGLAIGGLVIACCRMLGSLENLPVAVVFGMGLSNLCYGSFSLYVTTRKPRRVHWVKILAIANMLWLLVCLVIVVRFRQKISAWGLIAVIGEGLFVASLGYTEWRWRDHLSENRNLLNKDVA